jgi:DNA polymerase III subunit epsilon
MFLRTKPEDSILYWLLLPTVHCQLQTIMLWDNLAIVDVETTGGQPPRDRIIEIGIALVDHGRLTHTYSHLINPQTWISPFITQLTGITPETLENQPTFKDLASDIFPRLHNRLFVAHNARFDLSFIRSEFNRLNYTFTPRHLDSARLSRSLFPQFKSHSLDSLIHHFRLTVSNRHRALGDSLAIWDFFQKLGYVNTETLHQSIKLLTRRPALPKHLSVEVINSLPTSPGVYIFKNRDGFPLYIGKSINLKDRILSHFYADLDSSRERAIKDELTTIDLIPAAGDLEAQLIESQLVKDLQPIYNQKLRLTHEFIGLSLAEDNRHYLTAQLIHLHQLPPHLHHLYGLYKGKKQALSALQQLATDHSLCSKLLGLESTKRACFGYHLGQCRGACVGKESPARYNLRLLKALGPKKFLDWPFTGPIAIKESNEVNGRTVTHVFNHWHHLGTYSEDDSPQDFSPGVKAVRTPGVKSSLNLDVYKILHRYLQQHPNTPHQLT